MKDYVLVGAYSPLELGCQPCDYCFSPDVLLSAKRVPFLLDSSHPRAAVGLRFDVVHSLVEMKSCVQCVGTEFKL